MQSVQKTDTNNNKKQRETKTNIYELLLPVAHFNCGVLFTRRESRFIGIAPPIPDSCEIKLIVNHAQYMQIYINLCQTMKSK